MSETVQIALIAGIPATIASICGIFIAWLQSRVNNRANAELNAQARSNADKVENLSSHINSRMDKMIESLEAAAVAKGHLAGIEYERQRRSLEDENKIKLKEKTTRKKE